MSQLQSGEFAKIFGVFGVRRQPSSQPGVHPTGPFTNISLVENYLDNLWGWHNGRIKLVSGGSHGVEMISEEWALRKGVEFERVKPILHENHIDPFGNRNEKIIDRVTEILAFWDGQDTQIGRTLRIATIRQKPVQIIPVPAT